MLSDRDAEEVGVVPGLVAGGEGLGVMPMYWTPTCCRSKEGFLGLTARMMTKTTARIRRAKKEKRRKRQQQQPLKEAEEEEEDEGVVG
jgi:hypothetical protein